MRMVLVVIFCLFQSGQLFGQDEKFFRKLFTGELQRVDEKKVEKHYAYNLHTPEYMIDLNQDKVDESIVYLKRDSEDWIDVFNSYHELVYQYRFVFQCWIIFFD